MINLTAFFNHVNVNLVKILSCISLAMISMGLALLLCSCSSPTSVQEEHTTIRFVNKSQGFIRGLYIYPDFNFNGGLFPGDTSEPQEIAPCSHEFYVQGFVETSPGAYREFTIRDSFIYKGENHLCLLTLSM